MRSWPLSVNRSPAHRGDRSLHPASPALCAPRDTPRAGFRWGPWRVLSVRDITLERERDEVKQEFPHYVTHDLRNPLGSAIGFWTSFLGDPACSTRSALIVSSVAFVDAPDVDGHNILTSPNGVTHAAAVEDETITGVAGRSIAILESLAKAKNIKVNLEASESFPSRPTPI